MELIIADNYEHMSQIGADIIIRQLSEKPDSVLGLATGGTPLGVYKRLCEQDKGLYSKVTTFNLDEYVGIMSSHPNSYHSYMRNELFDTVRVNEQRTHVPDGMVSNTEAACQQYERLIAESGGIDLQLLGIGENGHIGFNEPGTPFDSETHKVLLKDDTRRANSRYFARLEDVPTHAITMGIGTILKSKKIVLLVSGAAKKKALHALLNGKQTVEIPATSLQSHPAVTVIADREALR